MEGGGEEAGAEAGEEVTGGQGGCVAEDCEDICAVLLSVH